MDEDLTEALALLDRLSELGDTRRLRVATANLRHAVKAAEYENRQRKPVKAKGFWDEPCTLCGAKRSECCC